ncbi:hypothetical protein ZIOFF_048837 [Zingiber officinale]|uniref:Formin-like protein n=1 Tax=Zingiber officinale TaxID=94328 RepID=A0A8J5KXZ9_ZINOF|nr:hypothetical protein ZIOFF_048837 [Zingiber officinale]
MASRRPRSASRSPHMPRIGLTTFVEATRWPHGLRGGHAWALRSPQMPHMGLRFAMAQNTVEEQPIVGLGRSEPIAKLGQRIRACTTLPDASQAKRRIRARTTHPNSSSGSSHISERVAVSETAAMATPGVSMVEEGKLPPKAPPQPKVADLRINLNTINSVAKEIRGSVKLKRIMQAILSLGNALNQGTARGSAIGFRLDSLLKLSDIRARNNKMTLLHYLCKVLEEKLPEVLDFHKNLVFLEAASKLEFKILAEEMQAISNGVKNVEQELISSNNDDPPVSETFCEHLKRFLVVAEAEVRSLTSLYTAVNRNADALVQYFGEDPARCSFEQVISTLFNFTRMFERAHEENSKQQELERKRAHREAEQAKMKLAMHKNDKKTPNSK